jgi:hypothetical protein
VVSPVPISIVVSPVSIPILVSPIPIDVNVPIAIAVDVAIVLGPYLDDLDPLAVFFTACGCPPENDRPQHHRPRY